MRDRAWKFLAIVCLAACALLALHQPPRTARAQTSGTGLVDMGSVWATVAPGASTNIFSTSLKPIAGKAPTPYQAASTMTIGVSLNVTGVLYRTETNGTTTITTALNSGNALSAFQDYTFLVPLRSLDSSGNAISYNFQLGTNSGIVYLRCQEILGGVD